MSQEDDEDSGQDLATLVLAVGQSEKLRAEAAKIRAEARGIDHTSATDQIVRVVSVGLLAVVTFASLYLVIRHPWLLEQRFPVLALLRRIF